MEACAVRQHGSPLGQLRIEVEESDNKPWDKKAIHLTATDFPPSMQAVMADQLYLPIDGLSNKLKIKSKGLLHSEIHSSTKRKPCECPYGISHE